MTLHLNHLNFLLVFMMVKFTIQIIFLWERKLQGSQFMTTSSMEKIKYQPVTPTLATIAKKGLLHYHLRNLSAIESNKLLYYIQKTKSLKVCPPISLFLATFNKAHTNNLLGFPCFDKVYAATKIVNYYFSEINIRTRVLMHDCLNCQTSIFMPNLLLAPQQPFLEMPPNFNHRFLMTNISVLRTKPTDRCLHTLHCSPSINKMDPLNALNV